jgi:hypothetical protein
MMDTYAYPQQEKFMKHRVYVLDASKIQLEVVCRLNDEVVVPCLPSTDPAILAWQTYHYLD